MSRSSLGAHREAVGADAVEVAVEPGRISRLRLAAACALLVGLAFVQDPGFLVADTKFDLVAAPGQFLGRAMHLWDAEGAFGQVQNQAYGYLWPMGPFFWLGDLLGLPGWSVQRSWQALVLCVAFVGTAKLARALGVRADAACLIAATAYALSPRMLTILGPISIEAWPSALAPWVLLPLVVGAQRGSPRRAAALSGLAIAMIGGVNAAATFAVIPLGVVWVLTRERGPRRRTLMVWWPSMTLLATLWWLLPLLLLGTYSPPFLDYIETGAVTTFPTTLVDSLRGTSNWVPYIDPSSRAGNDLVTTGYLAVNSGVVLLVGFLGLLDRVNPHRRFLGLGLGVGLVMVTAGHLGSVDGWAAADVRTLLDGALSPLRNVHKFDPIIRLPLVLGTAFALDRLLARDRLPLRPRFERISFTAMTLVTVAGAALPALSGRIEPAGATLGVPDYWVQTADWLAEETDGGVAVLAPGSTFGAYVWGNTRDEPMQWLADSRWAVRNVIPLTPTGNIRMLDEVERRLAQGDGSPALTSYLRRAGVEHLVVRNDLAPTSDVPDPVLVHQAIEASPGIDRVAEFGPVVGGEAHLETSDGRVVINSGRQATYAAVEVFAVGGKPASAAGQATVVAGGPEDLLDLIGLDALGDEPTVLAHDVPDGDLDAVPHDRVVLTDGLRDRERQFARIHDGYGPTRDPGYVRRTSNPQPDYLLGDTVAEDRRWRTTVDLQGARELSASSSTSDPGSFGGSRPGEMPAAALDGDPATAWVSGAGQPGPAWWRLDLDRPVVAGSMTLTGGARATANQSVRVVTEVGSTDRLELGPGEVLDVALPDGATTWVRVEDASTAGATLTVAEVVIDDVSVRRSLRLPALPVSWGPPDVVVMRAASDARRGCVVVGSDVRCAEDRAIPAEETNGLRRTIPLSGDASYEVAVTLRPRADPVLDRLTLRGQAVAVTTSSHPVADPRAGAVAAIDGDSGTTWMAGAFAQQPQLTLRWLDRRTIDGITVSTDADTAAAAPTRLELGLGRGKVIEVELDAEGHASFEPVVTSRLRVRVLEAEGVGDLDFDARPRAVPVGITELTVDGVPYVPLGLSADPVRLPCHSGPDVRIGHELLPTAVVASPLQLARGLPVRAEPCSTDPVELSAGDVEVGALGRRRFDVSAVVLTRVGAAAGGGAEPADLRTDGPARRLVTVPDDARVVVLHENTNPGWEARLGGSDLEPVVVDGWQQGFLLPVGEGDREVDVTYAPDRVYRLGLVAGAVGLVLLGAVLILTRRRWAGSDPSPVGTGRVPAPAMFLLAGLLAGLVAGWPGVAVAVVAGGVAWALDRWVPEGASLLLAMPCLVALMPYLVTPWGSADGWAGDSAWPHYVVLAPVVSVLVLAGLDGADGVVGAGRRPRFLRRRAGRSTMR